MRISDGSSDVCSSDLGQENTARMHYRSTINRRLVVAPLGEAGKRTRATYPEFGLMVEHRRVEDLGDALRPAWLDRALADRSAESVGGKECVKTWYTWG